MPQVPMHPDFARLLSRAKTFIGMQNVIPVLLAIVLVLVGATAGWGQATGGDIVGTVADKSGAAIPGADVSVKNTETGVIVAAKATGQGDFHISNLPPGMYDITASAAGFSTFTLKGFEVKLNNTATATLTLPVGTTATSVEVSVEAAAVIDTTTVQLQSSFETEELKNFPTASVGNGVLNLSLLVPGVASSGAIGAGTGPSVEDRGRVRTTTRSRASTTTTSR